VTKDFKCPEPPVFFSVSPELFLSRNQTKSGQDSVQKKLCTKNESTNKFLLGKKLLALSGTSNYSKGFQL